MYNSISTFAVKSFPENSQANLEKLAATLIVLSYMIDDNTAIKVTDGTVEVVSEGHWKLFIPDNDNTIT